MRPSSQDESANVPRASVGGNQRGCCQYGVFLRPVLAVGPFVVQVSYDTLVAHGGCPMQQLKLPCLPSPACDTAKQVPLTVLTTATYGFLVYFMSGLNENGWEPFGYFLLVMVLSNLVALSFCQVCAVCREITPLAYGA